MMPDLYDPLTYENLMAGLVSHFESIEKSHELPRVFRRAIG